METIVVPALSTLLGLLRSHALFHLEILALCQQLAMVEHTSSKRLRFHWCQRLFWGWLYRLWPGCLQTLQVFKPDTLVRWHRKGFRLYWTWKSRYHRGRRPPITSDVRELIRTMSRDNVGWGAPRIHGVLQMLGIHVSQATVAKYMIRHRKPPSQTWRTFLDNHAKDLVSLDFFTVPEHPSAQWTAQQIVETFLWDQVPRYLLRDRDKVYGARFRRRVHSLDR
ncbi:MAG: hypothetical protein GY794_14225 [bacterium]|nr:hypothetical protein [bacterium]